MKKSLILLLSLLTFGLFAQNIPPQAINFQGVAIDKDGIPVPGMDELGNPIPNKAIRVRFSVLAGGSQASASYVEEHLTNTDEYGRFNLAIGRGTASVGTFSGIQWGDTAHFLKVEIDLSGIGTNYSLTSIQEFLSVPYALYAKTSGNSNGNDNDPDPTNEIQNLNINGNQLSISSGNSVQLPASTDSQTLSINGNALSIANGNTVQLPVSVDNDTTNELQTLSIIGDTLKISNSNSVIIPTSNNTFIPGSSNPWGTNGACINGGTFYDFTAIDALYQDVYVIAIGSKNILLNCTNNYLVQPSTWMSYNRQTGTTQTINYNQQGYSGFYRASDSIAFFLSNNSIYWINYNNPLQQGISTNNYGVLSGHGVVDLKTNNLIFKAGSSWYKFHYLSNSYSQIPMPNGEVLWIGQDTLLAGTTLLNVNSMSIISNLTFTNQIDGKIYNRKDRSVYFEQSLSPSAPHLYEQLARVNISNNNFSLVTNVFNYNSDFELNNFSIEGNPLISFRGAANTTLNNYISHTDNEILLVTPDRLISLFMKPIPLGYFGNDRVIGRSGNYSFVQFLRSLHCHNGVILNGTGCVVYDAN